MKTNIIFSLAVAAAGLCFVATGCSNEYVDATAVHVYGENENPPLKGSDAVNANHSMTIQMNNTEWHTLDLNQYASQMEEQLGEGIDAVWAGLDNGTYRFLIVNPQRRVWDKTPANVGDDTWALSPSGIAVAPDNAALNLKFDKAARTLSYQLTEKALPGAVIPATVGIVKTDNSAFPTNFRIVNKITVADLSVVTAELTVPAGDYASEVLDLGEYLPNFEYTFGISDLKTISDGMDPNGKHLFDLYMMGDNGRYGNPPDGYTANNGYWLNTQLEVVKWGDTGFSYFIEQYFGEEDNQPIAQFGFGRAPELPAQQKTFTVVLALAKDPNRAMTFIVDVTFE